MLKRDLYYGAILSDLVNQKYVPALIDKNDSRGLYEVIVNNDNQYRRIFTKYRAKIDPPSKNQNRKRWTFSFTPSEVEELKTLKNDGELWLAFTCSNPDPFSLDVIWGHISKILKCVDLQENLRGQPYIRITHKKGAHSFKLYGNKGKDNEIKIPNNSTPFNTYSTFAPIKSQ
ncbi:hypothetical protein [Lentibacillus cibarius]|uniref:Uncharacterized protein n=1 Tax=Lentibacillus cibarius TaxID=2583219 RepID=A0A5S3QQ54_9BACI|nr:hypothetical protein [Lentibacillus cibarius]TMN22686.1 hypothetical protein FFL34_11710 [Lentibacillus cibarius]